MLNEKQVEELRNTIGEIIQINKGTFGIESVIVSYSENDEQIRLNLNNGYIVFNKEPVKS
ncbi:MAG: hypothetical protein SPJ55_12810 [Treponema sp.]|nr:hypothetical protein [Treponema sp.]MDY5919277.1 hypothetical protein [Treponema sp.]